jgi:hypothetical protein
MDDHVAKPTQLATLERALRPWLGQDQHLTTSAQ